MRILLSFLISVLVYSQIVAQQIPAGYILQYQQNFSNSKALSDFSYKSSEACGIFNFNNNPGLKYMGTENTSASPIPGNIVVLKNHILGDFILEAEVMPIADSNGVAEFCIFLGLKDSSQYYFVTLANRCDSLNHGIFVVKNNNPKRLTGTDATPLNLKENKWHKIRLVRDIVKRTIVVYVEDMTNPVLQIKNYELVMGNIGFGSRTNPGLVDNIKIWAPTMIGE